MGGFGAFGKMPALGDFFHVGLGHAFVSTWDDWLQLAIAAARDDLGDAWHSSYLSAPIWRFTLAPGLAGPVGMLGVLMPSVDRVGRHFPLTLAGPITGERSPLEMHFAAGAAFEALEVIALDTLRSGTELLRLQRDLAALPAVSSKITTEVRQQPRRLTLRVRGGPLAAGLAVWATQQNGSHAPSVWSTDGHADSRLMIHEGLPDPASMGGFFDLEAPLWRGEATQEARP